MGKLPVDAPTLMSSRRNLLAGSKLLLSRRSFLAGSRLLAAGAAAVALSLPGRSARAAPGGQPGPNPARGPGPNPARGPHCFLRGTRIATPDGEIRIEELRIGDSVLTASGDVKPIKWIARQKIERASRHDAAPVKISRYAIDGKAPHRDLYVSPAHAIYIDGVLIPAKNLVNGITIVADAKPEMLALTYYHIELDTHAAILAEGLAVESFGGSREAFDNADEYVELYGSLGEPLKPFAPVMPYNNGRQELASHIRSMLAPVYDFRKPVDKVRDRIADCAELARAA